MPELVEKQAAAIANIQFDKVIVWKAEPKRASPTTTGFLQNLMQALPPVHEMSEAAGIELPEFLGGNQGSWRALPRSRKALDYTRFT